MSNKRNGGDGFNNRAARKFREMNRVDLISQSEIFEILDDDMETILKQVTNAREHINGAKYPKYVANMFANLSTPLYFWRYVKDHVKTKKGKWKTDLEESDIESLKTLLAEAYKKSVTGAYSNQGMEWADRNRLILKAFERLTSPKKRKLAESLGLDKHQTRTLLIQVYGDPKHNMKYVHKLFNASQKSDKKKFKVFFKLYGKRRFVDAVGAALTVNSADSDFLAMVFEFFRDLSLKKRAPYLMAYAEAFKLNGSTYHQFTDQFAKENKKLIRELKMLDIGYKKAFKNLRQENGGKKKGEGKKKDKDQKDPMLARLDRYRIEKGADTD